MKEYIKILVNLIKKIYIPLILFILYITITYLLKIPNCPIKLITGYPCPGCGLTRAGFAALKFDFELAFMYNPAIFLLPFILWILIFYERPIINKIYNFKPLWIVIIIFVLTSYIIRMIYVYPNYPLDYLPNNLISKIINTIAQIIDHFKNYFVKLDYQVYI